MVLQLELLGWLDPGEAARVDVLVSSPDWHLLWTRRFTYLVAASLYGLANAAWVPRRRIWWITLAGEKSLYAYVLHVPLMVSSGYCSG